MTNRIIENIVSSIELITDPWIDASIYDFFHQDDAVSEFSYEVIDNKYVVEVSLKGSELHEIKEHFMTFVSVMQYAYFTFYSRRANDRIISYRLISGGSDMKGFYCEVNYAHA